jgi:probable F420-dependent oxidoreductase
MLWPTPGLDAGFERGVSAEAAGYDDLWFPDGEGMQDPIALAAALGVATERIRLCTGVVPVFNRPPAILATGVVAAEQRAPGRLILGLGSSTSNMVDRWYGIRFERPVQRVRETVLLLRQILRGEKSDFVGETIRSEGFRLKERPSEPVPIYLAAMGPKMLQLTGELADGVVLNDMTTPDRMGWALDQIDIGAKRAGRRVDDLEIVMRRAIRVSDDYREGLEFFRQHFAFYASAPAYQDTVIRLGYRDAVEEVRAGYSNRDRARITAAISDEMVERVFVFGDEKQCCARLRADYASGIETVAVSPQAQNAAGFDRTARAFAPDVFEVD